MHLTQKNKIKNTLVLAKLTDSHAMSALKVVNFAQCSLFFMTITFHIATFASKRSSRESKAISNTTWTNEWNDSESVWRLSWRWSAASSVGRATFCGLFQTSPYTQWSQGLSSHSICLTHGGGNEREREREKGREREKEKRVGLATFLNPW